MEEKKGGKGKKETHGCSFKVHLKKKKKIALMIPVPVSVSLKDAFHLILISFSFFQRYRCCLTECGRLRQGGGRSRKSCRFGERSAAIRFPLK